MENNNSFSDRMPTLLKRSNLPVKLQKVNPEYLKPSIRTICENIRSFESGSIFLGGPLKGKSTSAAAIMLNYLNMHRYKHLVDDVGYYVSGYVLCRNSHIMDKFNKQESEFMVETMNRIKNTKCLIVDDIFSNMTSLDAMLFNSIYAERQYCGGLTIYVSQTADPLECASSPLYRIARDAIHKELFTC